MKDIIKKWWFWVLMLLLFIFIIVIITFSNNSEGMGTAGISIEEFEEINLGMSQFEVNSIVDKLDEWNNDEIYEKCCEKISESSKDHIYTYEYKYYGENGGYVVITYEADYSNGSFFITPEVVKKEKFNLK